MHRECHESTDFAVVLSLFGFCDMFSCMFVVFAAFFQIFGNNSLMFPEVSEVQTHSLLRLLLFLGLIGGSLGIFWKLIG